MENLGLNTYVLRETAIQWHQEALKQAATRRLLNSSNARHLYMLNRQPRQLLHQLGCTFVHVGQWLEQHAVQTA